MLHVFRLGPIVVGSRHAYAFCGVDPDGNLIAPAIEHSETKALRELARRYAGQPLRCEPELAETARSFGFEPAPLPREMLLPRATLAYGLATGPMAGRPNLDVLVRFFEACAGFWRTRPWDRLDSDDPLPIDISEAGRTRRGEASVLGGGGEEFGLALYDEPGSVHRTAALVGAGKMREAARVSALAVTFDEEPAWAASALEDAFGLPRLPVALRVRRGKAAPAPTEELLAAAAALEAVVDLCRTSRHEASATAEAAGRSVTVRVSHVAQGRDLEPAAHEPILVGDRSFARSSPRTSRNAPCPCGSGKKYKKCHLAGDEERERAARGEGREPDEARRVAERHPVHAVEGRIIAEALALARQRWGESFDPDGMLAALGFDAESAHAVLGWSAAHYRGTDGRTALDLLLEERASALDAECRVLVEAERAAWFSYHEVLAAEPGRSITLRDLLTGREQKVDERSGSRMVRPRAVLLARVLELGDRCILAGCHPRALPPGEGDDARRRLKLALRVRSAKIPLDKLREATADGTPFRIWQAVVDAADARPPPRLQNTDGEDLLLTVDRFDVAPSKRDELVGALLSLPDASRDEGEDGDSVVVSFVREGNARGVLPTTLVGRAIVDRTSLRLETNSIKRADRLRAVVTTRISGLATFRIREHADPVSQLRAGAQHRVDPGPPEPMPPEVLEVVRKMKVEHFRKWLDEEVPALGGLTPRQAASRKGAARKSLAVLLAEIEHAEAGQPEEQRFDVAALRRELGVS